jgi:hypothetical protein
MSLHWFLCCYFVSHPAAFSWVFALIAVVYALGTFTLAPLMANPKVLLQDDDEFEDFPVLGPFISS